jgi:hypothetical protein
LFLFESLCVDKLLKFSHDLIYFAEVAVHSKICESLADCGAGECCGTVESGGNECLKYLETGQQCAHHADHPVNLIFIFYCIRVSNSPALKPYLQPLN